MGSEAGIYAREFDYLGQTIQLGIAQGRVLSVDVTSEPAPDAETEHELLDRLDAYFEGVKDDFDDVPVAMTMPTDQREVLEKVREVPYGEQARVEQLAMMVPGRKDDDQDDLRAIREALDANPAPIFIPSHRVRDGPSGLPAAVEQKIRSLEGL